MKRKTWISVLVMALLLTGLLSACSSKENNSGDKKNNTQKEEGNGNSAEANTGNSAEKEKKASGTVKVVLPGDAPKDLKNVKKAIEDKMHADGLDLTLEFTYFPWDQYNNKLNLIAASGENYDLAWTHVSWLSQIVSKHVVAPLDEWLEKSGQDLKENIPSANWLSSSIDNKIYGIPTLVPTAENNNFFAIRGDLRKKYNLPEIKTLADFEAYLDAIKKNEQGMVPVANDGTRALLREFGNVYLPLGDVGAGPGYIDPADPELKVHNFYESDIFKNIVNTKRKWYTNGWMPKDAQEIKDPEAALNNGKLGAIWSNVLKTTERIDAFKKTLPDGELEDVFLNPEKPKYVFDAASNLLSVFATSKNPEGAVAFVNWFRSNQENYDLFSYGVKDVNYVMDDSAISIEGIGEQQSYNQVYWAWDDIRLKYFSKHISPDFAGTLQKWDEGATEAPTLGFRFNADPVKAEIAQISAVEKEYVDSAYAGFSDYDQFFPKFQSKLKSAGIDKVITEMQKQLDAFLAAKK
ncbi:extracellular solute-binding protein [Paenibacillus nasutitermitis]|uniref:ABC transporter substrate-binding protein n=1 Tax=Paenibacillus nasutitermitis TaxID=1652958 RepID=A0A916ZBG1_9BACL|nr:extracellular solute-binding protein [Paenibacillus nasutitermitis]GGD84943.1 ABC transporter substrate-binding protein [Paenibacillus nasutitermitis]